MYILGLYHFNQTSHINRDQYRCQIYRFTKNRYIIQRNLTKNMLRYQQSQQTVMLFSLRACVLKFTIWDHLRMKFLTTGSINKHHLIILAGAQTFTLIIKTHEVHS